jgi:hypothetical protein
VYDYYLRLKAENKVLDYIKRVSSGAYIQSGSLIALVIAIPTDKPSIWRGRHLCQPQGCSSKASDTEDPARTSRKGRRDAEDVWYAAYIRDSPA